MEEVVKKDIISVLTQALFLIKKEDFTALKELSNHVIHNASTYQDQDSVQIAVIIYALGKILERAEMENKTISMNVSASLDKALSLLIQSKENDYRKEIKDILLKISKMDEKLLMYIQNVIEKANISKGGKIYSHGISIGRTAEILGVSQWELMSFIGKTKIADEEAEKEDVNKRLDFTRKLFRVL